MEGSCGNYKSPAGCQPTTGEATLSSSRQSDQLCVRNLLVQSARGDSGVPDRTNIPCCKSGRVCVQLEGRPPPQAIAGTLDLDATASQPARKDLPATEYLGTSSDETPARENPPATANQGTQGKKEEAVSGKLHSLGATSADDDFDLVMHELWCEHVETLPWEIAKSVGWGSAYWRRWYSKATIGDGKSEKMSIEVLRCAGSDSNGCSEIEAAADIKSESNAESPPIAEDDRRAMPALYPQQQQGGIARSKLDGAVNCPIWGDLNDMSSFGTTRGELRDDVHRGDRSSNGTPIVRLGGHGKFTIQDAKDFEKGIPYRRKDPPGKERKGSG